jgi:hypothetical protein
MLSLTRKRFLELLIGVAIVHGAAIALYYALDLPQRPERTQRFFAWSWMALTVLVVLVGLQRLKRARRRKTAVSSRP